MLTAVFLLSAMPSHAQPSRPSIETARPNPWAGGGAGATRDLEDQWAKFQDAAARGSDDENRGVSIRGVLRFALEATAVGWDSARVEEALAFGRSMQDLDPKSRTFGNFKWVSNADKVYDWNAVEFATQILGLLHKCHADKLTPRARRLVEEMMRSAIPALANHKVKIDYTNIWIKKAWCLIAIGECLGRPDLAADGYQRLDDWTRHVAENGITEFGAVTYYGTDLDTLGMIEKYAARAEGRAQALAAIRYLWTDAAANWWAPGDRLGGANSRSYNFLWGHGYFEAHTWAAGWLRQKPELERPGWLPGERDHLVAFLQAGDTPPRPEWFPPETFALPRTVVQRCGPLPEDIAVNWIGRRVSLGSAGRERGGDDRMLAANLGDSPDIPQLSLFMDGRGDPFGTKKTKNAAGQAKALHLVPFTATVQRGPEVLQMLSLEPLAAGSRHKPGELSCFQTHLAFPASAEVWLGDQPAKPGSPRHPAAVPAGAPVYIKIGDAVVAMRILYSDTTAKQTPAPVYYIRDSSKAVANRITIVHDDKEPRGRATVAVWLRATEGLDAEGFAAFRRQFASARAAAACDGARFHGEAAGLAGLLRIEADVAAKKRLVLEGGEPRPALLSINGREVGKSLFDALE
ncbi:hypothetical protein AW736_12270 [Termitidicoccus mucosus]|uniref:Alginate lyase domain-containing protein n=2 Tax=Termitidicoccus mucosus TaxID=1184151 RepID=A0A178IIY7_9BACT|nr:hypothetical protein AW736_12270 [Opitutaceae bacterium TSB47]